MTGPGAGARPAGVVPLDGWQVGPWNRWTYQHVREVVPTARVPHSPTAVAALPEEPRDLDGVRLRLPGGEVALGDWLAGSWTDGIAVLRDGALVYERYRNGMTEATRHISQSVAKSVTGLVAGALVARGQLDPASPVTRHVPELQDSGYAGATVQQLLDMTVAVDFVEDYASFERYDAACGWHPQREDTEPSILDHLRTIGPAPRAHGEVFHYASPNTDALGIVCERAGGTRLADLVGELLWIPLGAGHEADLAVDAAGTAVASGGFCATLRDYARLGRLVLDGGRVAGRTVVPQDWIATLGAGDPAVFARSPEYGDRIPGGAYRNQWWRIDGRTVASGIHGQLICVDPASRTVLVVLSSWPAALDDADVDAHSALQAALTRPDVI